MTTKLRITVLAENTAGRRHVLAEHGLALWLELDRGNILFDTGQGLALAHNAQTLGIDLHTAPAVVLSHGHYDHTGGLAAWPDHFPAAKVYVHPAAFQERYVRAAGQSASFCGSAWRSGAELEPHVAGVVGTSGPTEIGDGVWVTGEIPRRTSFEDPGGPFFLDQAGTRPDSLPDDQALCVDTPPGLVVLFGCGHAGVVNTLERVAELAARRRVYALLGGLHLLRASAERLDQTVAALRAHDVQIIAPMHCTGLPATQRLQAEFPGRFTHLTAGTTICLPA